MRFSKLLSYPENLETNLYPYLQLRGSSTSRLRFVAVTGAASWLSGVVPQRNRCFATIFHEIGIWTRLESQKSTMIADSNPYPTKPRLLSWKKSPLSKAVQFQVLLLRLPCWAGAYAQRALKGPAKSQDAWAPGSFGNLFNQVLELQSSNHGKSM